MMTAGVVSDGPLAMAMTGACGWGSNMPASALYSEIHDTEGPLLSPADMAMPALGLAGSGEQLMLAA
ncbi:MAG: hypothetical protein R3D03_14105 [Geminicoccaceae bacterium]